MPIEKLFRTKTGFCHILPDKIVLTRNGITGNITKVTVGNNISRILLIYGGVSLWLFYTAYNSFKEGQNLLSILLTLIGLFLIYGIFSSLNNSATPIIEREKIKEVRLKKGIAGLTRSRFEIKFEDENGKTKKRLIILPGSLTGGSSETDKAVKLMKEEKLIKEENEMLTKYLFSASLYGLPKIDANRSHQLKRKKRKCY